MQFFLNNIVIALEIVRIRLVQVILAFVYYVLDMKLENMLVKHKPFFAPKLFAWLVEINFSSIKNSSRRKKT